MQAAASEPVVDLLAGEQRHAQAERVVHAGGRVEAEPGQSRGGPQPDAIAAAVVIDAMRADAEHDERQQRAAASEQPTNTRRQAAALADVEGREVRAPSPSGSVTRVNMNRLDRGDAGEAQQDQRRRPRAGGPAKVRHFGCRSARRPGYRRGRVLWPSRRPCGAASGCRLRRAKRSRP